MGCENAGNTMWFSEAQNKQAGTVLFFLSPEISEDCFCIAQQYLSWRGVPSTDLLTVRSLSTDFSLEVSFPTTIERRKF